MHLFTRPQYERLIHNGTLRHMERDPQPVVKLHMQRAGCIWLLTGLDPDDPMTAFGLADVGMQCPKLECIDLVELCSLRLPAGVTLEQDEDFIGLYPISVYARAAQECGYITEDQEVLRRHQFTPRRTLLRPL